MCVPVFACVSARVCVCTIGGAYKFDLPPSPRLPAVKDL